MFISKMFSFSSSGSRKSKALAFWNGALWGLFAVVFGHFGYFYELLAGLFILASLSMSVYLYRAGYLLPPDGALKTSSYIQKSRIYFTLFYTCIWGSTCFLGYFLFDRLQNKYSYSADFWIGPILLIGTLPFLLGAGWRSYQWLKEDALEQRMRFYKGWRLAFWFVPLVWITVAVVPFYMYHFNVYPLLGREGKMLFWVLTEVGFYALPLFFIVYPFVAFPSLKWKGVIWSFHGIMTLGIISIVVLAFYHRFDWTPPPHTIFETVCDYWWWWVILTVPFICTLRKSKT